MDNDQHLLSESATWITESEFTDLTGKKSIGKGESKIKISEDEIINTSWVEIDNNNQISNTYHIKKAQENLYEYRSINPALGIQTGTFVANKNYIYSKFTITNTLLNGFEIIIRIGDICSANGALYDGDKLINTWIAKMKKHRVVTKKPLT